MSRQYGRVAFTPQVVDLQRRDGVPVAPTPPRHGTPGDPLTSAERGYLAEQDSFYVATVSSTGWPYVQFRGGPPGFLTVLDDHTVAWADVGGNLQYISTGNLAGDDRVAIIVLDQARRMRLKLFGHARVIAADDVDDELLAQLPVEDPARVERVIEVAVVAYDWNCPDHITPRYTAEQLRAPSSD